MTSYRLGNFLIYAICDIIAIQKYGPSHGIEEISLNTFGQVF